MIRYDLILKRYGRLEGAALLEPLLNDVFPGRIALVSSFGTEAAVLLHMVSEIDRRTPVIFLDTGKLFPETLAYRDDLIAKLGLDNVETVRPDDELVNARDANGTLWRERADACCHMRKVEPLERALQGYQAWITGRKRAHGGQRTELRTLETADWRLKVNPLAHWTIDEITDYFERTGLPEHPLGRQGYSSVGCAPCTAPPGPDGGLRSGRWQGQEKTECGIHWSANGRPIRVG